MCTSHQEPFSFVDRAECLSAALLPCRAVMGPCDRDTTSNRVHAAGMDCRNATRYLEAIENVDNVGVTIPGCQHSGERVRDAEVDAPKFWPVQRCVGDRDVGSQIAFGDFLKHGTAT